MLQHGEDFSLVDDVFYDEKVYGPNLAKLSSINENDHMDTA